MSTDVSDLRHTIAPRSDQTNAEDFLAGPRVITVTEVRTGSAEQPVAVHYEGDDGRAFLPCKTMRRVLICGWGEDGRRWVGRSMELYCDPSVRFGGQEVGGIRIKAMSDIPRRIEVALTATRGKKALHIIEVLTVNAPPDYSAAIAGLEKTAAEQGAAALEAAWKALKPADRKAIGPDELARLKSITTLKNEPVA